jgi:hypothetical protein
MLIDNDQSIIIKLDEIPDYFDPDDKINQIYENYSSNNQN